MPSYFELCIKVNTLAHTQHMHARRHTTNPSADSKPQCMEKAVITQKGRMICKYFIMQSFLQGQGMGRSTKSK